MIPALLRILDYHRGRDAAISADDLMQRMCTQGYDIPGLPEMRDLVHDARKAGHLIASCKDGYFLPIERVEADEFLGRLRKPALDMLHTYRIMRNRARHQFPDPQQMRMM